MTLVRGDLQGIMRDNKEGDVVFIKDTLVHWSKAKNSGPQNQFVHHQVKARAEWMQAAIKRQEHWTKVQFDANYALK